MPFKTLEKAREHRAKNADHFRAMNRKWNEANPEKVREMKRKYYLKNRERLIAKAKAQYDSNPKSRYDKVRDWKARNPEKEKAYQEKWASRNKDKIASRMKTYMSRRYMENPDKFKAMAIIHARKNKGRVQVRRRARLINRRAEDRIQNLKRVSIQLGQTEGDPVQIVEVIMQMKSSPETKCFYCGAPLFGLPIHIDHIIPLSRGGKHAISNLCASCPACNLSKSDKTIEEWNHWKSTVGALIEQKG